MELIFDKERGEYICIAAPSPWSVEEVEPHEDFTLVLTFSDGSKRVFDFRPLLVFPRYETLKNVTTFLKAQALHGTVDWGSNIDIAPEKLYEESIILV